MEATIPIIPVIINNPILMIMESWIALFAKGFLPNASIDLVIDLEKVKKAKVKLKRTTNPDAP